MSITKKKCALNSYVSMKQKSERFRSFLTKQIDFESQVLALIDTSLL